MKRALLSFIILLLFFTPAISGEIAPELGQRLDLLGDRNDIQVIVFLRQEIAPLAQVVDRSEQIRNQKEQVAAAQRNLLDYLATLKRGKYISDYHPFWIMNAVYVAGSRAAITSIADHPDVARIEYNDILTLPPVIKGPHVQNLELRAGTEANITQVGAPDAWTLCGIDGTGIKIGVVDTGARDTHVTLTGKINKAATFDTSGSKSADTAVDIDGHGTHVAGILVGSSGTTKIGVAPGAKLLVARVFDASDSNSNVARVTGGVEWVLDPDNDPATSDGADVINLSLGESGTSTTWQTYVDSWITTYNIPIVAAIGNKGPASETTESPGNVPNAIGVGAVDASDVIASFSSRGPVSWSGTTYIKPDVVAPGSLIYSADYSSDTDLRAMSGTSQATPHVAGGAALALEARPTATAAQVKQYLEDYAKELGGSGKDNTYGSGRIDLYKTVAALVDTTPPVITYEAFSANATVDYNANLNVTAEVTDTHTTTPTVIFYYRPHTSSTAFQALAMGQGTNNIYSATVPAAALVEKLEYYIKAADRLDNSATFPIDALTANHYYYFSVNMPTPFSVQKVLNYPNPMKPGSGTTFYVYSTLVSDITLKVYDLSGSLLKTLTAHGNPGYTEISWNGISDMGEELANGTYLFRYVVRSTDGQTASSKGKIIVLR